MSFPSFGEILNAFETLNERNSTNKLRVNTATLAVATLSSSVAVVSGRNPTLANFSANRPSQLFRGTVSATLLALNLGLLNRRRLDRDYVSGQMDRATNLELQQSVASGLGIVALNGFAIVTGRTMLRRVQLTPLGRMVCAASALSSGNAVCEAVAEMARRDPQLRMRLSIVKAVATTFIDNKVATAKQQLQPTPTPKTQANSPKTVLREEDSAAILAMLTQMWNDSKDDKKS